MATVLVTGGVGYIGSHTVYELYKYGYNVIIIDNLINSSIKSLENLKKIIKEDFNKEFEYYNVNLCNDNETLDLCPKLDKKIECIIHFAALKLVGESNINPLLYYDNNLKSLLNILKLAKRINCSNFIFSSSATVYPHTVQIPVKEEYNNKPIAGANNIDKFSTIVAGPNPYGTTKIMSEQILHDIAYSDSFWNIVILRYFNPAGYHKSGLLGEEIIDNALQKNLFPSILVNKKYNKILNIFGDNYNTPDGTAIRDYIHVEDLANAHIKALEWLENKSGVNVFNIGLGKGYSVKDIVNGFINKGFDIKYSISDKREGDAEMIYTNADKATNILGWKPQYSLEDMITSSINYYNCNC
jgi:UDP-glucose 4-epimerase